MKIDIEKVARLARLELTEEERERFGQQLDQILVYMDQLNRLDTSGVEPTSHAIPLVNVFREDEVSGSFPGQEILSNAPDQEEGYFKVPRIIE
ncbi:MAG: Asp-tRNA(Asn)/Glu-tRNA(Gln) amidotransferase subunit GatC [Desulfobacterota bacterium]|nr:Asp-tRNA(Asn)/Glu-tRNA(Gln) amidotransferase subunit GatC [Thermodesulfobacteriota bacterium]